MFGAQLAAALGLPYGFASHFAPDALMPALETYRSQFQPSSHLSEPYVMVGLNVFAAETEDEARYLRSSAQQSILRLRRGAPGPLPPPIAGFRDGLSPGDRQLVEHVQLCSVVGPPETIGTGVQEFADRTGADEVIITSHIFDHQARLRSSQIGAAALMLVPA